MVRRLIHHSEAQTLLELFLVWVAFLLFVSSLGSAQAASGNNSTPTGSWNPGATSVSQVANPLVVDMAKEASHYTPPNPNVPPTTAQTTWWVNNNPSLWNLSSSQKQEIIRGGTNILNQPYLPNGT